MILNISTFYKKNKYILDILADVLTLMVVMLIIYVLLLELPDSIIIYMHDLKIDLLDSIAIYLHNLNVHLDLHFSDLNLHISELKMQLLELEVRFSNLNKDLASIIQSVTTTNRVHTSDPSDLLLEEARHVPLPVQTEEEIKSLLNEPCAANVPLPPQSDEELNSLLDDSQNKD